MTSTDSWVIRRAAKYIVALDEWLLEILDREEIERIIKGEKLEPPRKEEPEGSVTADQAVRSADDDSSNDEVKV